MNTSNDNPRWLKGQALAATPGAVVITHPDHYKVRSQSTGAYYNVFRLTDAATWRCACPDYTRSQSHCKHLHAVRSIVHAQAEAARYAEAHGLALADVLALTEARLAQVNSRYEQQRLHIFRNALTLPRVAFEARFWWGDHEPDALFDPIPGPTYQTPEGFEVRTAAADWRTPRWDVHRIRDYILDQDLHLIAKQIERTRRLNRWQGLFVLTFATNGHGQFSTAAVPQ